MDVFFMASTNFSFPKTSGASVDTKKYSTQSNESLTFIYRAKEATQFIMSLKKTTKELLAKRLMACVE